MNVFGLIGDRRVKSSLSPVMFESVFAAMGYDGKYVVFNLDKKDLHKAIHDAKSAGLAGLNVTVPHKESVMACLDGLSQNAAEVGAVNTISFKGDRAVGFNTDTGGFGDLLEHCQIATTDSDICIIGAGGAAKAVLHRATKLNCRSINVINRTYSKAHTLSMLLGGTAVPMESASEVLETCSVLINTTSVSEVEQSPQFLNAFMRRIHFRRLQTIVDINYGRKDNFWCQLAKANGAQFVDGLFMLAAQGRRSFFVWTGQRIAIERFMEPLGLSR